MSVLSTLLHATNYSSPFLRTLLPSIFTAYALQAAVAVPSILAQTERFYDLSGSLTYLSCVGLSLYLPTLRARHAAHLAGAALPPWPSIVGAFRAGAPAGAGAGAGAVAGLNWRQVALSAAVGVWATRLGTFLFQRILKDGHDSRFDEIKKSPAKFGVAFFAQATWVSLCLMPVLAVNAIPSTVLGSAVLLTDVVGLLLYTGGLSFEVVADRQKDRWVQEKKEKKHSEEFLTRGLWSKSRHPNYFGEATLWTGIATVAAGVMMSKVGQVGMGLAGGFAGRTLALTMAGVSPAFVTFLLLKVSGVPLSENKYDKKYGDRKDYQEWKKNTPMFIPKL